MKLFSRLLLIVYSAQIILSLFRNDPELWSAWKTFAFHSALWAATAFVALGFWAYDKLNKK